MPGTHAGREGVDVSLARALSRLPSDHETETVIRDVITLMTHHTGEWLPVEDIARKSGNLVLQVRPVLEAMRDAFVLDFDDVPGAFRYRYDVGVSIEFDAFLHRSRAVENHMQTNVARFRERYGSS